MACCVAVALVIGVLRAGWFRLRPGARPERAPFAPPARRSGPGGDTDPAVTGGPAPSGTPGPARPGAVPPGTAAPGHATGRPPRPRSARTGAAVAAGVVAGIGLQVLTVALGAAAGIVVLADGTRGVRDAVLVGTAVVAGALALALRARGTGAHSTGTRRTRADGRRTLAVAAAGLAWVAASVLDMHAFGLPLTDLHAAADPPAAASHAGGAHTTGAQTPGHGTHTDPAALLVHLPGLLLVAASPLLARLPLPRAHRATPTGTGAAR